MRLRLPLPAPHCHAQSCMPSCAMDVTNIREWCREFAAGCIEIHDEESSGWPSIPDETVAKFEQILRENQRNTLDDLLILVPEVSQSTIHRVLSEKWQYRKVCAR
uniref:Uncharacterized protein n=1 Tax=Octopus bimaculoides TaxID=37653 RepID=A0A0L8HGL5_OCTBM